MSEAQQTGGTPAWVEQIIQVLPHFGMVEHIQSGEFDVNPLTTYSGTKAEIYCQSVDDVADVLRRIGGTVESRALPFKAATFALFETPEQHPEHFKGVVVYLPHRATQRDDLAALMRDMEGYNHANRRIAGTRFLGNGVGTRFDLQTDLGRDVSRDTYFGRYQRAANNPEGTSRAFKGTSLQ